jgi:hypothetical protein
MVRMTEPATSSPRPQPAARSVSTDPGAQDRAAARDWEIYDHEEGDGKEEQRRRDEARAKAEARAERAARVQEAASEIRHQTATGARAVTETASVYERIGTRLFSWGSRLAESLFAGLARFGPFAKEDERLTPEQIAGRQQDQERDARTRSAQAELEEWRQRRMDEERDRQARQAEERQRGRDSGGLSRPGLERPGRGERRRFLSFAVVFRGPFGRPFGARARQQPPRPPPDGGGEPCP